MPEVRVLSPAVNVFVKVDLLRRTVRQARNLTHLIGLLGFADGGTTRAQLRKKIESLSLDVSHFNSRPGPRMSDEQSAEARRASKSRLLKKYSAMRAALINQERWILEDSRRDDRRHRGVENDLDIQFIRDAIKSGCSYCGERQLRMTLDRVDNALPHTKANVVPACIRCSYTRRNMPHAAWLVIAPKMREAR